MTAQNKNQLSIFFIGHIAIDTIIRFHKEHTPTLGGSVSFGSLSLRTYTNDVDISIITHLGSQNFDKSLLSLIEDNFIDVKGVKWSKTHNTNFVLDYFNHSRSLTLKSRSPNLDFKDIPESYLKNPPDVILLAPLCNEISYNYISEITRHFPNAYIALELQGFIRKIDNGHVSIVRDKNIISTTEKIIDLIGNNLILKGSEEEMKILSGEEELYKVMDYFRGFESEGLFMMTLGEGGSLIINKNDEILKIPAFKSRGVVDETGAGDVYFAIFLYEFIRSDKSWVSVKEAAYLASSAASFNVEQTGPYGFETKPIVLERMNLKNYIS
jgi:sugar/nucleoside kinase (ribokinase family)